MNQYSVSLLNILTLVEVETNKISWLLIWHVVWALSVTVQNENMFIWTTFSQPAQYLNTCDVDQKNVLSPICNGIDVGSHCMIKSFIDTCSFGPCLWLYRVNMAVLFTGIYGGFLLGTRSVSGLAFYDWESTELIRRIEITPKNVSML